jgi:hypothetical protein
MIDLGSVRGLLEHDHELHAYCARCGRWRELDLGRMVALGQGDRRLPLRVRCLRCREIGLIQVRPPMPTRSPAGWINPPTRGD